MLSHIVILDNGACILGTYFMLNIFLEDQNVHNYGYLFTNVTSNSLR